MPSDEELASPHRAAGGGGSWFTSTDDVDEKADANAKREDGNRQAECAKRVADNVVWGHTPLAVLVSGGWGKGRQWVMSLMNGVPFAVSQRSIPHLLFIQYPSHT
jgi:hypothetical protein